MGKGPDLASSFSTPRILAMLLQVLHGWEDAEGGLGQACCHALRTEPGCVTCSARLPTGLLP